MKIGELSERTGVSIPTIRVYEREGLISTAERTDGRFRIFSEEHLLRLSFIKTLRNLGLPLTDIKSLIALSEGQAAAIEADIPQAIAADLRMRIEQLERLLARLTVANQESESYDGLERIFAPRCT